MVSTAYRVTIHLWAWARAHPWGAASLMCLLLLGWELGPRIREALRPPPDAGAVFHAGALRVGLDPSRPPFAFFSPDGAYLGLEPTLALELGDEFGVPVELVGLGFDGLYDALTANQVDVVIAGLQPDFLRDGSNAFYSRHYFDAGLVLVGLGEGEAMRDLPGLTLAYEFGSPADAEARRWLRRVRPFEVRPYELPEYALDAARLGEADAALVDATTARLYLREHPDWNPHTTQITNRWYTVVTRADRPDILNVINDGLQALHEAGRLDAILDEWL